MGYKHKYSTEKDGLNLLLEAIDRCENETKVSLSYTGSNSFSLCNMTEYYVSIKKNARVEGNISVSGYRSIHGYGLCELCGKKIALTNKNELRRHVCSSSIITKI